MIHEKTYADRYSDIGRIWRRFLGNRHLADHLSHVLSRACLSPHILILQPLGAEQHCLI